MQRFVAAAAAALLRRVSSSSSSSSARPSHLRGDRRTTTSQQRRHASTQTASTTALQSRVQLQLNDDNVLDPEVVSKFVDIGLPRPLARQLITSFPHIHAPTLPQIALLEALSKPNDIILRAHTGTGKSFALLLGLLSKPRVLFSHSNKLSADSDPSSQSARPHGIASIIVVPSNELAFQYYAWAKQLLAHTGNDLHPIIQILVRGHPTTSPEAQLDLLRNSPPHLLVATPTRLMEILSTKTNEGASILGLSTLRTLALDECDALLDLPGRFPTHKLRWKHTVHPAPSLIFLNELMRLRPSCSGGQLLPSAGLERQEGRHFDERRPPEAIRRNAHLSREALSKSQQTHRQREASGAFYSAFNFAQPRPRYGPTGSPPVQLVVASATANAVLRHFFGARTGWLRTGVKEAIGKPRGQSDFRSNVRPERITGVWLDLTGLTQASADLLSALDSRDSKKKKKKQGVEEEEEEWENRYPSGAEGSYSALLKKEAAKLDLQGSTFPMTMPEELTHYCLVVDEPDPSETPQSSGDDAAAPVLPPMRNLDPRAFIRPFRQAKDLVHETGQPDYATTIRSVSLGASEVDPHLLSALAFAFASGASSRALALIPPQWSLRKAKEMLEGWGVPVRTLDSGTSQYEMDDGPVMFLLQATSARGLDLPVLSHVFIVGIEAIGDAVRYTHLAGRASRIGPNAEVARIPQPPRQGSEEEAGAAGATEQQEETLQSLRPLAKVITIVRGLPHASVLRRRAALQAWSALSKSDRVEQGKKRPAHDAIMVSSAERKLWTIWRRTGVSGRARALAAAAVEGQQGGGSIVGGIGKVDLRLAGGEAVDEEEALRDWVPEEGMEDEGEEEEVVDEDEDGDTDRAHFEPIDERETRPFQRPVFDRPAQRDNGSRSSFGSRADGHHASSPRRASDGSYASPPRRSPDGKYASSRRPTDDRYASSSRRSSAGNYSRRNSAAPHRGHDSSFRRGREHAAPPRRSSASSNQSDGLEFGSESSFRRAR